MENTVKYTKDEINEIFKEELKKHYFKREIQNYSENNNKYLVEKNNNEKNNDAKSKIFTKYKYKLMIRITICLIICLGILVYKRIDDENVKNNEVISWIKAEYSKAYTIEDILEGVEDVSKIVYSKIDTIIPDTMYDNIVNNYLNIIKPNLINFSIDTIMENKAIENTVAVFNEDSLSIDDSDLVIAQEVIETSSEISLMDMDCEEILAKNISIIIPVSGTITSVYGTREVELDGIGYHTGIDIANEYNTQIMSATDGVVVSTEEMNVYYGNTVEVETNGVIFKYSHLNQINVSEGAEIKQGDIVGLMGSTGMSTGSHLHFEIRINSRTVDPELILSFDELK